MCWIENLESLLEHRVKNGLSASDIAGINSKLAKAHTNFERRDRRITRAAAVRAIALRWISDTAGQGYGRFLLADALYRSVSSEIAAFAVIVDVKDDDARRFHERESFLPFPDHPMRLFRPMADLARLFK